MIVELGDFERFLVRHVINAAINAGISLGGYSRDEITALQDVYAMLSQDIDVDDNPDHYDIDD
jgi:hypothetical protein